MKREDKNHQSRQKILTAAIQEFGLRGYGLSSINTICTVGDISKGIMYHHFVDKDELFLACIQSCFSELIQYLDRHMEVTEDSVQDNLRRYFEIRQRFFQENPLFQKIFCDAVMMPPSHLFGKIVTVRDEFEQYNIGILHQFLKRVKLRSDITMEEVIETFKQYQDYMNAVWWAENRGEPDLMERERKCGRALSILLYGVVAREENQS